ncbi:MAG TPA: hypothetical protein ENK54_08335, partial [Thiotrichales bacterium]|nr:hypothetical protein [Thiotrichales bacterium]
MKRLFLLLSIANVVVLVWLLASPAGERRPPLPPLPAGARLLVLAPDGPSTPATPPQPEEETAVPVGEPLAVSSPRSAVGESPPVVSPPLMEEGAARGGGESGEGGEQVAEAAAPPLCLEVGPLARAEGERLLSDLAGRGVEFRTREVEIEEPRYWVFVPPASDLKAAFALSERLREAGLRDLQVIPGGPKRNAISLGLYRNAAIARERRERIRALGFDVSLEETSQKVSRLLLETPVPAGVAGAAEVWVEGLGLPEGPEWRVAPCTPPP